MCREAQEDTAGKSMTTIADTEDGFEPDDLNIMESAIELLNKGNDLDDRATVERALVVGPYVYCKPATFQRFVDACIIEAKSMRAERWFGVDVIPMDENNNAVPAAMRWKQ